MKAVDNWVVYLLRCSDQSLYCGITNNLEKRLATHNHGKGARYTQTRLPVTLVAASAPMSKSAALKLEFRIKKTPRSRKRLELKSGQALHEIEKAQLLRQVHLELRCAVRKIRHLCAKVDNVIKTLECIL
jgi:putative endonuclease